MKIKILLAFMVCIFLSGCSDPKDYRLPEKISTITEDVTLKKKIETLNEENKQLFAGYAMRAVMAEAFGKPIGKATTVGEAITIQQTWLTEQAVSKATKEKKKQEAEVANFRITQQMHAAITSDVKSFAYEKKQREDHLNVGISFKNNSDSEIVGIKGDLVISDMFGTKLKKATISTDSNIKPGEELYGVWSLDYNQFIDGDKTLKNADPSKLVFGWKPQTYIFADGNKLTLPN